MDAEAITGAPIQTATVVALTSAEQDSTAGPVQVFTATADVGNAPLPYYPWPLSISIVDLTLNDVVYEDSTGPNGDGAFSFYFAGGELRMPGPTRPIALATIDPSHDFAVAMTYEAEGYVSSTSPFVDIP